MAATTNKTLMSVEQYLKTSFEEADCDYVDGEVLERNVGELPHSFVQKKLLNLLSAVEERSGVIAFPEIRVQVNPRRFRVADLAVWRVPAPRRRIPETPPFLVIEVLSTEDRFIRMQPRILDYLSAGVEYVWVIDPDERKALVYSQKNPVGAEADVLRTDNPAIEIPLSEVLPPVEPLTAG